MSGTVTFFSTEYSHKNGDRYLRRSIINAINLSMIIASHPSPIEQLKSEKLDSCQMSVLLTSLIFRISGWKVLALTKWHHLRLNKCKPAWYFKIYNLMPARTCTISYLCDQFKKPFLDSVYIGISQSWNPVQFFECFVWWT